MEEYLALKLHSWFPTGKTDYRVQAKRVSRETKVWNFLEDVRYTAHPNGEDLVLKGTVGEEWVSGFSKAAKTYTRPDGSALVPEDFAEADAWIGLKTIPDVGSFACFIPVAYKVAVTTASGDLLHANRDGVTHGGGDYLVCRAGADGRPDLSDVWVVNGAVFAATYDLTNAG